MTVLAEQTLADRYGEILQDYLKNSNETALNQGYEVARHALKEGSGVIEMAMIHHRSLQQLFAGQAASEKILQQAGDFFAECLSPFEMSHRGARDGALALRHVNEVLETEIKRVAHALHDEAGQLLATVHIALAQLANDFPSQARPHFDGIEELLLQIENELRSLSHELRPTVLDNLGLLPALELLAEKVSKRTGLSITVFANTEHRVSSPAETALYRVTQEALNNIVKHARAKNVKIEFDCKPSKVSCYIRDDGVGFAIDKKSDNDQSLGILGMRERISALGGSFRVITRPGRGTTIRADIPLRKN